MMTSMARAWSLDDKDCVRSRAILETTYQFKTTSFMSRKTRHTKVIGARLYRRYTEPKATDCDRYAFCTFYNADNPDPSESTAVREES